MNYKIERVTFHSYNDRTKKIEKEIDSAFGNYDYSRVSKIKSEDLIVMLDALFETKCIYHNIYVIPMELVPTGLSVVIPLKSNNFDEYMPQLQELVHLIGKPTSVFENKGTFYANWVRNVITWF